MKSIRTFFDGESDPDDAVIAVAQNNTVQGRIANYMVIPAQDELFKIPRVGMGDSDPLYGVVWQQLSSVSEGTDQLNVLLSCGHFLFRWLDRNLLRRLLDWRWKYT